MEKKEFLKKFLITFIYAVFTLLIVLHHEVWSDEAQVWVLCRDCSFFEMVKLVKIEGHPLLWYFLVFPFAKLLHFPNAVMSMQILNWIFVIFAAGFFVFKSPFSYFLKISLLLSAGFLYWYPCIARSYCLIPILMFIMAYYYKKQERHPYIYALTLGILANTHVIMFGFCFVLAVIFFIKNRTDWISKILLALLIFAVPIYLVGSVESNSTVNLYINNLFVVLNNFFDCLFGTNIFMFKILFFILLLLSSVLFFQKSKAVFWVVLLAYIYQFLIYMLLWIPLSQRAFLVFLLMIWGFWIVYDKTKNPMFQKIVEILIILNLVATMYSGFLYITQDLKNDFSAGKKTAEFIMKNTDKNSIFISIYPVITPSVSAYLPDNKDYWLFYYAKYKDFYTYIHWDKKIELAFPDDDLKELVRLGKDIYVITSINKYLENIQPVFEAYGKYNDENFKIYKIIDY